MMFVYSITNAVVIPAQAGTLKRSLFFTSGSGLASAHRRRGALTFSLMKK